MRSKYDFSYIKMKSVVNFIVLILLLVLDENVLKAMAVDPKGRSMGETALLDPENYDEPDLDETFKLRQAPFCIDVENEDPEELGLTRFLPIFGFHETENSYVPVSTGSWSPSGMVNFEVSRISVADSDSGYNGELKNWLHINITSQVELQGLYVQAISAPWGIPFGEFISNFDCGDCDDHKTSNYENFINIIPCMSRSAVSYFHPNVFTVGGKWIKGQPRAKLRQIHFNFRYIQYPGDDKTWAQFLIIAVRKFHLEVPLFETFFTQIYKLGINDNPTGSYHPFYHGWKTSFIKCHDPGPILDFRPWEYSGPMSKLRYSSEFDNCVRKKTALAWFTCPPGPLQLSPDEAPTTLTQWNNKRSLYSAMGESQNVAPVPNNPGNEMDAMGSDVQFCADSGVWDWTLGQKEWETPTQVTIVEVENEDHVTLDGVVQEEQSSVEEDDDANCEEENGVLICRYFKRDKKGACDDYHGTLCETPEVPKYSKGGNTLTDQFDHKARNWGEKYILHAHGLLMMLSWTALFNILAYVGRYHKEASIIQRNSIYFGIGKWLWQHMIFSYLMITSSFAGVALVIFQRRRIQSLSGKQSKGSPSPPAVTGLHDLCNIHTTKEAVSYCVENSHIHRYCGLFAMVLCLMSYSSSWSRSETSGLRNTTIAYHLLTGYLGKIVAIACTLAYRNLTWTNMSFFILIIMEVCSIIIFVLSSVLQCLIDKELSITERRIFPSLEGIDTFEVSSKYDFARKAILWLHVASQIGLFILFAISY